MVTVSYTSAFTDLVEGLGDPALALDGFLDHGDSLGLLLGSLGDFELTNTTRHGLVLTNPLFRAEVPFTGTDLITVTERADGTTVLEVDTLGSVPGGPGVPGLQVTSGLQRLWIEGDLPDTFTEISALLNGLTGPDPDLMALLAPYEVTGITVVLEEAGTGTLSYPFDLQLGSEGLTLTFAEYTFTADLPGLTTAEVGALGDAVFGLVSGTGGLRAVTRALDALPPAEVTLTDPDGDTIFGLSGDLGDLTRPARIMLEFTGDNGRDAFFGGAGKDMAIGAGGNDRLFGFANDDVLRGGAGRDRIDGGRGDDTLSGGRGPDTFLFGRRDGDDTITDFTHRDTLALDDALWRGDLTARQVLNRFAEVTDDGVLFDFGRKGSVLLDGLDTLRGLPGDLDLV